MKNTIKLLIAFVVTIGFYNNIEATVNPIKEKTAIISFENTVIDYGTIVQNSNGIKIFEFTNTGNAPLLISKVKTSCGCTVPEYPKQAIAPGASEIIKIKYDTKRLGAFTKTITVMSNTKNGTTTLKIKGNVVAK